MASIKFAIREKNTHKLLHSQLEYHHWEDGGYAEQDTEFRVELDGEHGLWTTDSAILALIVKEGIAKGGYYSCMLPILDETGDFEIVAIHEMVIGSDNVFQVTTTENVTQSLDGILTDDLILQAKASHDGLNVCDSDYERLKALYSDNADNASLLKIDIQTGVKLWRMLQSRNLIKEPCADEAMLINELRLAADFLVNESKII